MTERKRILIVDDDPKVADVLRDCLAEEYTVETASDGAQALKAVGKKRPDLMILDISMPEMTGVDVLKKVRGTDTTLPIIMLTGNTDIDVAAEALRLGASAYAPKPVHLQYLEHLVAVLLMEAPKPAAV